MATRKPGTTARAGSRGTQSRDKGTRGGRPEASTTTGPRQGNRPGGRAGNGRPAPARTKAPVKAAAEEAQSTAPPLWFQLTTWILSLGGLGVSIYLTIAHYNTAVSLACPATSTINCEKVTSSAQSMVFGIPVAVLGLAFYVFLAVVNSPWAWRITWPALRWARVGSLVVGIVFVLYLIYAELFSIRAICLWCTSVHVITFILFVLIVFGAAAGYGAATGYGAAKAASRA
ncbi:MAG: hypothetical protein J2P30_07830 [Actinobacteria bacterium]|nr:hypothetical protein [Actinomycetota bacterium]